MLPPRALRAGRIDRLGAGVLRLQDTSLGRFLPADHSKGDEKTLGGYMAVHARPAAFEGSDGLSYSVDIATDETGDPEAPIGAYLLFLRWSRGEPGVSGHIETDFIVRGEREDAVRSAIGALSLDEVKQLLNSLLADRAPAPARPWWEVMKDDE